VTGDRDLLALRGQMPGVEILTPAQFAELLA
jgi:predicted nucleic acid-binding protein